MLYKLHHHTGQNLNVMIFSTFQHRDWTINITERAKATIFVVLVNKGTHIKEVKKDWTYLQFCVYCSLNIYKNATFKVIKADSVMGKMNGLNLNQQRF